MGSLARKQKRNELKRAVKRNKEEFRKLHPGKKYVDIKFSRYWNKYKETVEKKG